MIKVKCIATPYGAPITLYGIYEAEQSEKHTNFWIIKQCDDGVLRMYDKGYFQIVEDKVYNPVDGDIVG